MNWKTKLKPRW